MAAVGGSGGQRKAWNSEEKPNKPHQQRLGWRCEIIPTYRLVGTPPPHLEWNAGSPSRLGTVGVTCACVRGNVDRVKLAKTADGSNDSYCHGMLYKRVCRLLVPFGGDSF